MRVLVKSVRRALCNLGLTRKRLSRYRLLVSFVLHISVDFTMYWST